MRMVAIPQKKNHEKNRTKKKMRVGEKRRRNRGIVILFGSSSHSSCLDIRYYGYSLLLLTCIQLCRVLGIYLHEST